MAGFVSGPELAPRRRQQEVYQAPPAPKPLNVVLACWKGDQDQAVRLLSWIAELGMVQAPFYLLCDNQCNYEYLLELARKAFSKVEWLEDKERVETNWHQPGDHPKSAAGPNSLFRQCAWHFMLRKLGPWLFLEPDAIPCKRDWYSILEREYQIGAKPFMGYKVTPVNHPGVPQHMSGVAIYHEQTPSLAPLASNAGEVAFDIAGVTETCKDERTWFTQTIFHKYRAPSFLTEEDFNSRVVEPIALYHSCKDGSIIPWLRKRLGIKGGDEPCATSLQQPVHAPAEIRIAQPLSATSNGAGASLGTQAPTVDLYIKTCKKDADWFQWCIKSVEKYGKMFRSVVIQGDENDIRPGYLWQQVCKLHADQYIKDRHPEPNFIVYIDSDCVLTREVALEDFVKDGKPIWQYAPLDQARPDQHTWVPIMEKFLGQKPTEELMRRHCFCLQPWMLREIRQFCGYRHNAQLRDYIMNLAVPGSETALVFSEWNCLGFFLRTHHRDKVHWVSDSEAGPAYVYQGHTWSGEQRKQEDLAKFRELLGENPEGLGVVPREGGSIGSPALTIQSAIEFLASQVNTNADKARIVHKLKTAWKGRGVAGTRKTAVSVQPQGILVNKKPKTLLCIHSYPGGNEAFLRHWPNFQKAGADRIVGIGTTDGKCTWPEGLDGVVDIGSNSYMKLKGKDDHLCRRLLDTVKWCLTQPEDRFIIAEYDVVFLKKMPSFKGVQANLTGGQVNGSKTTQFFHSPWCFDRESAPGLITAMEEALPHSAEYPDNSPDLFFGYACERAGIKIGCNFKHFSRNTINGDEDLSQAIEAALDGAHCLHGCKEDFVYNSIMRALNEKHLSMSHAA